jgi:hypothetical protein
MSRRDDYIYLENTEVPPERTAGEITGLLVRAGARHIQTEYGTGGELEGLRWSMQLAQQVLWFSMPVRTAGVFKQLMNRAQKHSPVYDAPKLQQKAKRVAWRQLLRWTEVQVAMIQSEMVEAVEVFLPYLQGQSGQSLYCQFKEDAMKALPAPEAQERTA